MATITGEKFQPVRLHYRILNRPGLLRTFEKLRCVDYDSTRDRWVWLYDHEARKLRFQNSYSQLPKQLHPIIIGSFFLRSKETLLLDLRSCERALLAIPFFDARLSRKLVELGDAEVVNRLFPLTRENLQLSPDTLFDSQTSTGVDHKALVQDLLKLGMGGQSPAAKLQMAIDALQAQAKQPLPEIERIPTNYVEDGIGGFTRALRLRQIVAAEHWLGNREYSLMDAMKSVTRGS